MDLQHHESLMETFNKGQLFRFASLDLAPNDQLETGFSVVDRHRNLVRVDKIYKDTQIVECIRSLGPPPGTIIVIDMPKSLSIPNRWQQEEIKMHPFRLERASGEEADRFEGRGRKLYDTFKDMGAEPFLYFNYWTRMTYDLLLPFRSRSPMGCRTLQAGIEDKLGLKQMPTNLSPSSVLESMVGAYAAWTVWAGEWNTDFELAEDETGYRYLVAKGRPHTRWVKRIRRTRRRFSSRRR